MIDVNRLTYAYPQQAHLALQGLDLHVRRGEQIVVAGRSGSGKSTLLRALNGLVPRFYGGRFSGRVVVDGIDTRRAEPLALAGKVGYVFQEPEGRFLTTSVVDEIAFGLEMAGASGAVIRERVDDIVGRLELGALVDRPLDRLSGGEQQRVAVAAALLRRPPVLLMDEPTSQLDAQSAGSVLDWVGELRHQFGLTVLIAEHRLWRLLSGTDRLLFLDEPGRAVLGEPSKALAEMSFVPPLVEVARCLGLPIPVRADQCEQMRQRILSLGDPAPAARSWSEPRLEAKGLVYAYNGVRALNGISIGVQVGEAVAVMGRNGSGKTTLLRSLMGLLRPQEGEVRLDGARIDDQPVSRRARRIAYVPQWPSALLFDETVRAELDLTLSNHGLLQRPPIDPEDLLCDLGLQDVAHRYPRDLSAGERQRAAMAAVLVTHPDVILLDEPTLGIDPLAQAGIGAMLSRWREEGRAVVVATHDVEFAAAYTDTALILDRGRVVASGPTAETLFAQPCLQTAVQQVTGRARPATAPEVRQMTRIKTGRHAQG
jgi:energy-coupling factor transporter ATP-binding protein EcfA2